MPQFPVSSPSPAVPSESNAAWTNGYRVRLARTADEVRSAQHLRFLVFNLELKEGLDASYATGLDADPFDAVCDHLLVEEQGNGTVVGTYRLQTGERGAGGIGYYSAREFDFAPFESFRPDLLELGRACIVEGHRSFTVLSLLWRGIARYAAAKGSRYLVGCSSLPLTDPAQGVAAYRALEGHLAGPEFRTVPLIDFACMTAPATTTPPIPRLLHAYLALGARICGPPALDREFGTIDFLTVLDLATLPDRTRARWGLSGAEDSTDLL